MLFKKRKLLGQVVLLQNLQSRLRGMGEELVVAGEPMLSMKVSALMTDIKIAIESCEIQPKESSDGQ